MIATTIALCRPRSLEDPVHVRVGFTKKGSKENPRGECRR